MEGEKSQGQGDEGQQKQDAEDKLPRLYLDTIPVEVTNQIFLNFFDGESFEVSWKGN